MLFIAASLQSPTLGKTMIPIAILSSQVGYDTDAPKKIILRGPKNFIAADALVEFIDQKGCVAWRSEPVAWGSVWGSHWWIVDFSALRITGTYIPRIVRAGTIRLVGDALDIEKHALFSKTAVPCGPGQLSKRKQLAQVRPGWFDAGALWQLVGSHCPQIVGMCDVVRLARHALSTQERNDYLAMITDGTTYLSMCRDKAEQSGFGRGAMVQCLAKIPDKCSPYDSFTAAMTFAMAAELLLNENPSQAQLCKTNAELCLDWALTSAKPLVNNSNVFPNQGLPDEHKSPLSWPTRSLMVAMHAEVILCSLDEKRQPTRLNDLSQRILARQIRLEQAEHGHWGHFYAYDNLSVAEKSWSHGMPIQDYTQSYEFGSDNGMVFAHPVFCFIEALRRFPHHPMCAQWLKAVKDFANHYFKPMCLKSPFSILPRGYFGESEPLWFAGVWHGCNVSYGMAAALAMEFEKLTNDPSFRDIAYGNLQWIAGLNAGITREAIQTGCTISTFEVPEGVALPASLIQGVGRRTAGCWTNIRGSICNGFGTGTQFVYDVPPLVEHDAPSALHDEDWISHSGGFLMGLARWEARTR